MQLVHKVISQVSLPVKSSSTPGLCSSYCNAKLHQLPYGRSTSRSTTPLQLLFLDVQGPALVLSRGGFRYYLSFADDYSRFTWIFPFKCKYDVVTIFLSFKRLVETLLNIKIHALQSNWGGEFRFLNSSLHSFGISHLLSCPYAHSQNGSVKRKHRHIVETGLALLPHLSTPQYYQSDAFTIAVFLINRLPTTVLHNKSPFEVLFHQRPDYTFLKTFGCTCWPNLRPYNQHKMNFQSFSCVFLGYISYHHGYLCFHLATSRMYISRDVLLDETNFSFSSPSPNHCFLPNPTLLLLCNKILIIHLYHLKGLQHSRGLLALLLSPDLTHLPKLLPHFPHNPIPSPLQPLAQFQIHLNPTLPYSNPVLNLIHSTFRLGHRLLPIHLNHLSQPSRLLPLFTPCKPQPNPNFIFPKYEQTTPSLGLYPTPMSLPLLFLKSLPLSLRLQSLPNGDMPCSWNLMLFSQIILGPWSLLHLTRILQVVDRCSRPCISRMGPLNVGKHDWQPRATIKLKGLIIHKYSVLW